MWLARDKSGDIYIFKNEPVRKEEFFTSRYVSEDYDQVDEKDFIEDYDLSKITWENSPVYVETDKINI